MIKQWIARIKSNRFWKQHDKIIAKFKIGRKLASFKRHSLGAKAGRVRIRRTERLKKAANDA